MVTPTPHKAPISDVAIAPNGLVLTVSYDGAICAWRVGNGTTTVVYRQLLHSKGINCIAVDTHGRQAATGGSDGCACIVSLEDPKTPVLVFSHPGDVETILFSADGRFLLTGGTDGTARIFEIESGKERFRIEHGKTVGASCRDADEKFVLTGCNDRGIRKIGWETGEVVAEYKPHSAPIKALVVTKSGIVSAGHDTRILMVDSEMRSHHEVTSYLTTPKSMAVEPDGVHFWVGAYDQTLTRWSSIPDGNGEYRATWAVRDPVVWPHGIAATSDLLAAGAFAGAPRCYARLGSDYVLADGDAAPVDCISSMTLDRRTRDLVVGGDAGTLSSVSEKQLGDSPQRARRAVGSVSSAITGVLGSDGTYTYGCWDGTLGRIENGRTIWRATLPNGSDGSGRATVPVVGIAQDEKRVLAGLYTGGAVCLEATSGRTLWTQPEATGSVKSVSIADVLFAMTGRYDPLRVGLAETGEILARLPLETSVSDFVEFRPDGGRLAVCAAGFEVWLVDVRRRGQGLTLSVVHRGVGHIAPVKAIAWLDDDSVVSGCYAGHVFIHRTRCPSIRIAQVDSRLGISSLVVEGNSIYWATFDGDIGRSGLDALLEIAGLKAHSVTTLK